MKPSADADDLAQIAAEFLAGRAEAAGDNCDSVFERSDAELADRAHHCRGRAFWQDGLRTIGRGVRAAA